MRKILFGVMIFAALLIAACEQAPTTVPTSEPMKTASFEVVEVVPVQEASDQSPEALTLSIVDFKFSLAGTDVFFSGKVLDSNDVAMSDMKVQAYCEGKSLLDIPVITQSDGTFKITGDRDYCLSNDEAWVEVEYEGKIYQSDKAIVPVAFFGSGSSRVASQDSFTVISEPVGVPEFSMLTLGLAVIAGSLGLVLLRRE